MSAFFVFLSFRETSRFFMYVVSVDDTAMPDRMHMTGAKTNMRRTMTPWNEQNRLIILSCRNDKSINLGTLIIVPQSPNYNVTIFSELAELNKSSDRKIWTFRQILVLDIKKQFQSRNLPQSRCWWHHTWWWICWRRWASWSRSRGQLSKTNASTI